MMHTDTALMPRVNHLPLLIEGGSVQPTSSFAYTGGGFAYTGGGWTDHFKKHLVYVQDTIMPIAQDAALAAGTAVIQHKITGGDPDKLGQVAFNAGSRAAVASGTARLSRELSQAAQSRKRQRLDD